MTHDVTNLQKLVNTSGFAFQLAVEAAVRGSSRHHGWEVEAREYPWQLNGRLGYIDMVLSMGPLKLIVECKRVLGAEWVFLMPDEKQKARSHARLRWTCAVPQRGRLSDWDDVQIDPPSPEAEFCIVRGQGEDRPLLERLAGQIVDSTDAVARDLLQTSDRASREHVLIPTIVTTAQLFLCAFDPTALDLGVGQVSGAAFQHVPSLRFRKSLAPASAPADHEPEELKDFLHGSLRTVFVVHAGDLIAWLHTLRIRFTEGHMPWDQARRRAEAMGGWLL